MLAMTFSVDAAMAKDIAQVQTNGYRTAMAPKTDGQG
jgi:hypothetical protein